MRKLEGRNKKEVSTSAKMTKDRVSAETRVNKYKVEYVNIYEVKESELDELERGSQADLFLEFAIFCLSVAISLLASLLTAEFKSAVAQTTFVCVVTIGFIAGAVLLLLWRRCRKVRINIISNIKRRGQIQDD